MQCEIAHDPVVQQHYGRNHHIDESEDEGQYVAVCRKHGVEDTHHRTECGEHQHESASARLLKFENGCQSESDQHSGDQEYVEGEVEFPLCFRVHHL